MSGGTFPRCARCLRSVEQVDRVEDHRTGGVTFTAHCHGERESVTITSADLMSMGREGMAFTVAFSKTRAAEQRRPHWSAEVEVEITSSEEELRRFIEAVG